MSNYPSDNGATALATRNSRIEDKIDRETVGQLAVSNAVGGVSFQTVVDLMEFAKLMAVSGICIPKHLRGEPGACLAICMQAVEWRMSPYAVANKSYVVNDRISYESQLIHAVVEQRAPLVGRLRASYDGDGPTRRCTITGIIKGEPEPLVYTSSPFSKILPKNSPLWTSKPDLQLFYNASRDWARMYFPDLILGVYSSDEIEIPEIPAKPEVSRTAALAQRFAAPPVVVPHPTAPTQTIDTSDSNLPPTEVAEQIIRDAPRAPETEPDVGGVEAEGPGETIVWDFTSPGEFVAAAKKMADKDGVKETTFTAAMTTLRLSQGIDGGRRKDIETRNRLYGAMDAGAFDWNLAKIV